jgi:hypothetical protein
MEKNTTTPADSRPPPDKDNKITDAETSSLNREVALTNENQTTENKCTTVEKTDTSHSMLTTSNRKDSFEEEIMRPSSPNKIKYQEDIEDILNQDGSKVKTIKTFKEITGACPKINAKEAVGRQVREMSETETSSGILSFTDVKKETIIGEDGTKLVRTSQVARVRYNRPHYRNSASTLFIDTNQNYASSYAARALNYRSSSIAHSLSASPVSHRNRMSGYSSQSVEPETSRTAITYQQQYELMEQQRRQQYELHEQQRLQQQLHQQQQHQHRQELIANINQRPPMYIPSSSLLTFSSSVNQQQQQYQSLNQSTYDTRHYQNHQTHHQNMHHVYHTNKQEEDDRHLHHHDHHRHHQYHVGHGSRNYYYRQQNPTDYVYNRGNRQYIYLSPPQYRSSSYGCASQTHSRYSMPPSLGMSLSPPPRHHVIREIVPPTFSYEIENVSVQKGGAACFKGTVNGSYPFETRWFVNDREVRAGERFEMTTRQDYSETFLTGLIDYIISLRIYNCSYSDIGKYTVFVRNEAGDASCSAFLVFEGTYRQIQIMRIINVFFSMSNNQNHFL